MRLQFYRSFFIDWFVTLPIVFQDSILNDQFFIKPNAYTIADHYDSKFIPFAYFIIRNNQGLGWVLLVVV